MTTIDSRGIGRDSRHSSKRGKDRRGSRERWRRPARPCVAPPLGLPSPRRWASPPAPRKWLLRETATGDGVLGGEVRLYLRVMTLRLVGCTLAPVDERRAAAM